MADASTNLVDGSRVCRFLMESMHCKAAVGEDIPAGTTCVYLRDPGESACLNKLYEASQLASKVHCNKLKVALVAKGLDTWRG